MLLYLYDHCGRRRQESIDPKIPGCILADLEGQLCTLAGSPDPQLPSHSHSIPNCELPTSLFSLLSRFPVLTLQSSLLFRLLVLRGPHISHSPTPPMSLEYANHSEYHVNDLPCHHSRFCSRSISSGVLVWVGHRFWLCVQGISHFERKTWLHSKRTLGLFLRTGEYSFVVFSFVHCCRRDVFGNHPRWP